MLAFDLDVSPDALDVATNQVAGGLNGTLHNFSAASPAPPTAIPATDPTVAEPTPTTVPTVETVAVSTRPAAIPTGCKSGFMTGPDSPRTHGSSTTCDTLNYNGKTYWVHSYVNNRFSMCIVEYDSSGNILNQTERSGARYLWKISVDPDPNVQTVTFHGQNSATITVAWSDLPLRRSDLCVNGVPWTRRI